MNSDGKRTLFLKCDLTKLLFIIFYNEIFLQICLVWCIAGFFQWIEYATKWKLPTFYKLIYWHLSHHNILILCHDDQSLLPKLIFLILILICCFIKINLPNIHIINGSATFFNLIQARNHSFKFQLSIRPTWYQSSWRVKSMMFKGVQKCIYIPLNEYPLSF